jgi:hypothetical protein
VLLLTKQNLENQTRDKIMTFKEIEIMLINRVTSAKLSGATLTTEDGKFELILVGDHGRYSFELNGIPVSQIKRDL